MTVSTLLQHETLLKPDHYGTYVSPVIGTTTGYPSRPAGANSVHYIGPLVPTDMQANDMWTDTSGSGAGTGA